MCPYGVILNVTKNLTRGSLIEGAGKTVGFD